MACLIQQYHFPTVLFHKLLLDLGYTYSMGMFVFILVYINSATKCTQFPSSTSIAAAES